ncbi:unnamed protein product [Blepharisma stoltei]|uniref:Uncharacterized protein n=1 Tax=Blepharisma stoltei TaxID=1481888 RepID=A0AAU9IVD4_9CILI|nr:unnamed protein product [Blepharisma stoltei]
MQNSSELPNKASDHAELEIVKNSISEIINKNSKCLEKLENVKTETKASLINFQINFLTNDLNSKLIETENALNVLNTLKNKTAEILSIPITPILETDFRATCSAYQSCPSIYDPPLMQAYQDYLNAYQQKTSLYNLSECKSNKTYLHIYNTETETKEVKILETPQSLNHQTSITQLPNGKLFCYGKYPCSGITAIVDVNGKVEILASGVPCSSLSCIYFDNSIYCFGRANNYYCLSRRFDLDQNRWIRFTSIPNVEPYCISIIFKRNILISEYFNKNLLLYSIDIDSFSIIPYKFAAHKTKFLINTNRLYLIECGNGSIYESEIESYINWQRIAESTIDFSSQLYCSYNKGGIYIGMISNNFSAYY